MKNFLISILSIIALIISGIWMFKTNFSYEPVIVFILGVVGVITHFVKQKKSKVGTNNNTQTLNLSLNVDSKESNVTNTDQIKEEPKLSREEIIESMKPKTNILFIDDDKTFKVVKILKDANWKKTKSTEDIKGFDIPLVKDSDIFFVDINGVGNLLDCEHEGLDLAQMIKEKYPDRKVVIYSANSNHKAFHPAWDICDYKLEKNALPYQFQKLVEKYSIELFEKAT